MPRVVLGRSPHGVRDGPYREPMEPMPPLQGAVRPAAEPAPAPPPKHPRFEAVGEALFPLILVLFFVDIVRRDGFSWIVLACLVLASTTLGAKVATLNRLVRKPPQGQGVSEPS